MDIVYCVAFLGLAVILFVIFLLDARRPGEPGRASDGVTHDVFCAAIVSLFAYGAGFGVQFVLKMNAQALGIKEVALVAAILAACYLAFRMMAPRRRLTEYAAEIARRSGASESYPANVVALALPEGETRSPSEPSLPKAA